jgi:arginase family enzyme
VADGTAASTRLESMETAKGRSSVFMAGIRARANREERDEARRRGVLIGEW